MEMPRNLKNFCKVTPFSLQAGQITGQFSSEASPPQKAGGYNNFPIQQDQVTWGTNKVSSDLM